MMYIGIDPGAKGGIGVINTRYDTVKAYPYSDETLIDLVCKPGYQKVMVEKVAARPGQGVVSMFNFGKSYGTIIGILKAAHKSYDLVLPRRWKAEFGLDADKQKSIDCCHRLFPLVELRASDRARTDSDGMAEALLIAEFARRKMK